LRALAHVAVVAALVVAPAARAHAAPAPGEFRFSPRPNRAHEIHWRAWSADAFATARAMLLV
jgi:hypothetical protein